MRVAFASLILSLTVAPAAVQAADAGAVAGYLTKTTLDGGGAEDDGTGFGVKGWVGFGGPFAHFEYQSTSLDTFDMDVESLRVGGGMAGDLTRQLQLLGKAEYVDFGSDFDLDGFGVHAGLKFSASPQVTLGGAIGYLSLGGPADDADGLEASLNAAFKFTRHLGAFFGYRTWKGSFDAGGDLDIDDLSLGMFYTLGR